MMILFIQLLDIIPTAIPSKGPPIDVLRKVTNTAPTVVSYPFTIPKNIMKNTMAVPSFNRDSPSIRVLNLTLAPSSFIRAITATGSVADNIAPNVKASGHVRSYWPYINTHLKQIARRTVPHRTPGTARIKILTMDLLNTNQLQLKAE